MDVSHTLSSLKFFSILINEEDTIYRTIFPFIARLSCLLLFDMNYIKQNLIFMHIFLEILWDRPQKRLIVIRLLNSYCSLVLIYWWLDLTVIFKMLKSKKNNKAKASNSRNKRIITIYASQNSVLETVPKGTSVPLKKANKSSVTNLNTRPK